MWFHAGSYTDCKGTERGGGLLSTVAHRAGMRWPGQGCARSTRLEYVLPVGSLDQCFPNTGLTEVGDCFQWPTMKKMVKLNHAMFT